MPQLASGGWTPIDRNESAASVSMSIASMSGKKTIAVVDDVAEDVAPEQPPGRRAEPFGCLDELAPAQGENLAADRSRDVRDVDDRR